MKREAAETQLRAAVGARVRNLRRAFGLSQVELARRSGRDQSTISKIESGDVPLLSISLLIDVAWGLGVEPFQIFEWPPGVMALAAHDEGRVHWHEQVAS